MIAGRKIAGITACGAVVVIAAALWFVVGTGKPPQNQEQELDAFLTRFENQWGKGDPSAFSVFFSEDFAEETGQTLAQALANEEFRALWSSSEIDFDDATIEMTSEGAAVSSFHILVNGEVVATNGLVLQYGARGWLITDDIPQDDSETAVQSVQAKFPLAPTVYAVPGEGPDDLPDVADVYDPQEPIPQNQF